MENNCFIGIDVSKNKLDICVLQGLKSVSILGDSYSTFEGYVQPDTNFVWYPSW